MKTGYEFLMPIIETLLGYYTYESSSRNTILRNAEHCTIMDAKEKQK